MDMSDGALPEMKVFLYPWYKAFVSKIIDRCSEMFPLENICIVYVYLSFPENSGDQVLVEVSQREVSNHSVTRVPCVSSNICFSTDEITMLQHDVDCIVADAMSLQLNDSESMFDAGIAYYNSSNFTDAAKM